MINKLELMYKSGVVESYNTSETESAKKAFFKYKNALSTNGFKFMTDNMPVKVSLVDSKGFVIDTFCPEPDEKRAKQDAITNMSDILHHNLRKCLGKDYYGRIVDHIHGSVIRECVSECKGEYQSVTEDDIANVTGKIILNIIEEKAKNDWNIPILKRDLSALFEALQRDPLIRDKCKKLKCMANLETFIRKDM